MSGQIYGHCRAIADYEIKHKQDERDEALKEFDQFQKDSKTKLVFQNRTDRANALKSLRGHLYEYPIGFLKDDLKTGGLEPPSLSAEGILPAMTFT